MKIEPLEEIFLKSSRNFFIDKALILKISSFGRRSSRSIDSLGLFSTQNPNKKNQFSQNQNQNMRSKQEIWKEEDSDITKYKNEKKSQSKSGEIKQYKKVLVN